VPDRYAALQLAPQLIPLGLDVTVPEPAFVTVSVYCGVNVAVTVCADVIATAHVPVPLHAPAQPVNTKPVAGAAVSVTDVP